MKKKIILCLLNLFTLLSNAYSQTFITVNNNADFKAAINNAKYTATIVQLGLTNCVWSQQMKVFFAYYK